MQRKGSFTSVPTYKRILKPSKKTRHNYIGIIIMLIVSLLELVYIPKWVAYEYYKYQQEITYKTAQDNRAFDFLMTSGKRRLNSGKISGVYSEFKLAYAIYPNDKELNQSLIETLEILCLDYNRHCSNYNKLKSKSKL